GLLRGGLRGLRRGLRGLRRGLRGLRRGLRRLAGGLRGLRGGLAGGLLGLLAGLGLLLRLARRDLEAVLARALAEEQARERATALADEALDHRGAALLREEALHLAGRHLAVADDPRHLRPGPELARQHLLADVALVRLDDGAVLVL